MDLKDKLSILVDYLTRNRRTGYTSTILKAAQKYLGIILVNKKETPEHIANSCVVNFQGLFNRRGSQPAMLFVDNEVLLDVTKESFDVIEELELRLRQQERTSQALNKEVERLNNQYRMAVLNNIQLKFNNMVLENRLKNNKWQFNDYY
jgi:hypothetical protein